MGKGKGKGKKPKKKDRRKKKSGGPTDAQQADKYVLYQASVQNPEADVEFFEKIFHDRFNRTPTLFREDFCGTFQACCTWADRRAENRAWGIDLDPEPLAWGREHNLVQIPEEAQERVTLLKADVRDRARVLVDIVAAQNFSYCIFKTRAELRTYFKSCLEGLLPEGMLVLDLYGGYESLQANEEETEYPDGFSYVWDTVGYDAITNEVQTAIHFRFPDKSELTNAFTYDWRLWTIAEVREILLEAGFSTASVYWEGVDDDGEGDGDFVLQGHAENEPGWIAYMAGVK
ncbi:MAG: class I SAM-dependent methyltransferase [Planctomycetes bacterium]|nr:class I SAM-dependent methyltransferase [Planctomycetota bacterium]